MRQRTITVLIISMVTAGCGPSQKEQKLQAEIDELKKAQKDHGVLVESIQTPRAQQRSIVNGSVFVVARNGTNFKLALVPITVSSVADYDETKKKVAEVFTEQWGALISQYKQATDQQSRAYDTLKHEYSNYQKLDQEATSLVDRLKTTDGTGITVDTVFERISIMTPIASMPAISGLYPSDAAVAAAERLVEVSQQRKVEGERVKPFVEAYVDAYHRRLNIRERAKKLETAILPELISELMQALADRNGVAAKSDADGMFSVTVEGAHDSVILTGYGRRSVGDSEEKYFWKVQVNIPQLATEQKVFLSNGELIEAVVEFPSLLGRVDTDYPNPDYQHFWTTSGVFRIERS